MNIVFCFMDGGEDQEEFVKEKLMALHVSHPVITGAQVNFLCEPAGATEKKICQIDLTAYGDALQVSKAGGTFRDAAELAVAELSRRIETQTANPAH